MRVRGDGDGWQAANSAKAYRRSNWPIEYGRRSSIPRAPEPSPN